MRAKCAILSFTFLVSAAFETADNFSLFYDSSIFYFPFLSENSGILDEHFLRLFLYRI